MSGNKKTGIVLTARDMKLLRALLVGRVLDCRQVMAIAGFRIVRRANFRLLKLVEAGLLKRFFISTEAGGQKALYALSRNGATVVGEPSHPIFQRSHDELLISDSFIAHQLTLNAIWILIQFTALPNGIELIRWLKVKEPLTPSAPLVPDSYFELRSPNGVLPMFLEVDRGTEPQKTWIKKIELYLNLALKGDFKTKFNQDRFRVLIVALSERRLGNIRRTVAKRTDKIFWFSTLDNIKRSGMWSPIWARPTGDSQLSLL